MDKNLEGNKYVEPPGVYQKKFHFLFSQSYCMDRQGEYHKCGILMPMEPV